MYQQQLNDKIQYLQSLLQDFAIENWHIVPSLSEHYRMRAEFRIWHEGERISYAMFQAGQKAGRHSLIELTQFPVAAKSINDLMPILLAEISGSPILRERWYQCEFLATLSGEMLLTLIYHKKLGEEWEVAARELQEKLSVKIIGRSRGQKIVLKEDFVTEKLNVAGQDFVYRQIEGGFSQPNAKICEQMLAWAQDCAADLGGDLLELYCGNGNFTLPLSTQFNRVLATEVSKTSVAAALWNIQANGRDNIRIARLSAEELTAVFSGSREFQRLKEQGIDLQSYDFSTIFIDPPRAGVDAETLKLVAQFDNVIYVSCNPLTLRENLDILSETHTVERAALFDQFPFTHHIESGVLLKKRA
ncbi:tRNA (uracil-5-)-methyltransferase [Alysiella filiformis DSM 16848]|uniref:tRNA/tmRNA (uracil-C(5))-methyltransferase n=2 Tax=Alysiella TaxID=194195 RepID=A0A286E4S9_9NEIS|nr:tRNA (uracil-5-)-methyltransferase [Alysiella filiformis DSM 16848]